MKLTATFIALAAARDLAMGSQSANLVVGDDSMGAGIVDHTTDDMYNQLSKAPTPAPSGDSDMHDATHVDPNIVEKGDTTQIDEQTDREAVPTAKPTAFPTKDTSHDFGTDDSKGADNTADECCAGTFCKPTGWVGAGPGADYCNIWKCERTQSSFTEQDFVGTFRKQTRVCSVEQHGADFCSHTTCTYAIHPDHGKKVIMVHSDHKEEVGGFHQCGFSQHAEARSAGRPGCDCICSGARRQDAADFQRKMSHIAAASRTDGSDTTGYTYRGVVNGHDSTTNFDHPETTSDFDANHNSNNFYSQHTNYNMDDTQGKFSNANANTAGGDGTTNGIDTTTATQYNENDHQYQGEHSQYGFHKKGVAHVHIDN